jgi:CHAT domain-containing protein/tetratricopeptide (TPR) repeat protein
VRTPKPDLRPVPVRGGLRAALGALCLTVASGSVGVATGLAQEGAASIQSVRTAVESGRYAHAETEAERLVSALQRVNAEPSEVAQAIDLLVEALLLNGKGAETRTRELAEQVIEIRQVRAGPDDPALASSLRNLGDVLVQRSQYQLARPLYERARLIRERGVGAKHPDVADDLDHLANLLTQTEKYDEALTISERALAIKETSLGTVDLRIARTLEVRGLLFQRRGDYPRARASFERALSLRELVDPSHPDVAGTLSALAEHVTLEGDLIRGQQLGARAVALAEDTLRPDHPQIASYLRVLAVPVRLLGDLAGARALRERALEIAEKSFGPDHPAVAIQLNDLAVSAELEADYAQAYVLYQRALNIYERHLGPDHSYVTTEVHNLGIVSDKLGDYVASRRYFNRAISTWERVVGPNHPFVALALTELARMLSRQGRDAEARPLYERVLSIRESALGKDHRDVGATLIDLSNTTAKLGQLDQARALSTRAVRILTQLSEGETPLSADALRLDASLQAAFGDYGGARTSYDRALLILRRLVGNSHPDVAEVQLAMAVVAANNHQPLDALQRAIEAEGIGRAHLRLMLRHLPERQGLEYAARRPRGLDFALSLAAASRDAPDGGLALDELIRSRGLVLDDMAERWHLSANAARPDLAASWAAVVSARQRFANLVIREPGGRPDQHGALVDEARQEKEEAERALAEKSVTFRQELSRGDVGLEEVRSVLSSSTALISFARYDRSLIDAPTTASTSLVPLEGSVRSPKPVPSYIAFVMRDGQSDVAVVPLGSANAIDTLVTNWRRETTGIVGAPSRGDAEMTYRNAGAALRRRVWDPLREQLTGVTTVFVVPDGMLNLVSLAALPVGATRYLIDDGPVIHYLSAERDLAAGPSPSSAIRGLLAVGGAAFNDATLFAGVSKSAPAPSASSTDAVASLRAVSTETLRAGCGTLQSMQFTPLAGTSREVREVAALWTDSPAQVLEGRGASEQAFKREAPGHRVLHLATHGFFLGNDCMPVSVATRSVGGLVAAQAKLASRPRPTRPPNAALSENPLLMSGLALAGANRRAAAGPEEDDGILTAEEVTALNLEGVEWAVLSACDTGLGEVKAGEGVFGLRRAFQVAGVRTVIMSLWPVDDQATRIWMRALYQGRLQKRLTTAEAIHNASLSVLRERRARGQSTHPFYWAAFVAAGDWR